MRSALSKTSVWIQEYFPDTKFLPTLLLNVDAPRLQVVENLMQVLSKQDSHSSHRFFKDTWHCLSSSSNLSFTSSIIRKAS